jgi:hypothetical protein
MEYKETLGVSTSSLTDYRECRQDDVALAIFSGRLYHYSARVHVVTGEMQDVGLY